MKRRLGDVELQVRALQLDISLSDVRRQREPCRIRVDRGASRLAERALIDRAVLTPKIELPIERRLQLLQRAPATCQRRRRFTLRAETLAVDLEVGVDPRVQRR